MGGTMEGAFSWPAVVLVFRALALILVLSVLWFAIDPVWREFRYRRLHAAVRKQINDAVRQIGSGTPPVTAHRQLAANLNNLIGPLLELAAGLSPTTPFIEHLIHIVDPNAPERSLDLELLQVKYCFAHNCDHLQTPFKHEILITGSAASNPNHSIFTIQQPGIQPVGPVPIPGVPNLAGALHFPLNTPQERRFPIIVGQSQAFVDVEIQDMDRNTRIICDCQKSQGPVDLKDLTPPKITVGTPGPGSVLQGAMASGTWPAVKKRKLNAIEETRFYSTAISNLNGSWIEKDVVNFLKRLHKTMHSF